MFQIQFKIFKVRWNVVESGTTRKDQVSDKLNTICVIYIHLLCLSMLNEKLWNVEQAGLKFFRKFLENFLFNFF